MYNVIEIVSCSGFLWELLTELSRSQGSMLQDVGTQSESPILTSQSLGKQRHLSYSPC